MYVDESGDPGLNTTASRYYILSGMVVHETAWRTVLDRLVQFRRRMKGLYKLRQKDEIHASPFIHAPAHKVGGIIRGHRLGILRAYIKELSQIRDIRFIHVLVDKQGKAPGSDLFDLAWMSQRTFFNSMSARISTSARRARGITSSNWPRWSASMRAQAIQWESCGCSIHLVRKGGLSAPGGSYYGH